MWVVTFEQHYKTEVWKSTTLRTTFKFTAELYYTWWYWCYVMCEYPVKSLSIQFEQDGVVSLKGRRAISDNADLIPQLKRRAGWIRTKFDL